MPGVLVPLGGREPSIAVEANLCFFHFPFPGHGAESRSTDPNVGKRPARLQYSPMDSRLFCPEAGRTAGLSRTSVGEEFERQVGFRISCGMLISELRSQSGQANPMYSVLC